MNVTPVYCPACENACSDKAPSCPKCGHVLMSPIQVVARAVSVEPQLRRVRSRRTLIALAVVGCLALVVIGAVAFFAKVAYDVTGNLAQAASSPSITIPLPASVPDPPAPKAASLFPVQIKRKKFNDYDYSDYVTMDIVLDARQLKKPARSIKGKLRCADLFGEVHFSIGWTIDDPVPVGEFSEDGLGVEYNEFRDAHSWLRFTEIENMIATYQVDSILYADGTREDF